MGQLLLFGSSEPATPIARRSDPVTSHKAAAKVKHVVTARQLQCLDVLREHGQALNSKELAAMCCEKFCHELKVDPKAYADKLENFRKRADEIKRNPDLCVRIGQELDGGELFEARVAK